jgi:hypothetical protein
MSKNPRSPTLTTRPWIGGRPPAGPAELGAEPIEQQYIQKRRYQGGQGIVEPRGELVSCSGSVTREVSTRG